MFSFSDGTTSLIHLFSFCWFAIHDIAPHFFFQLIFYFTFHRVLWGGKSGNQVWKMG